MKTIFFIVAFIALTLSANAQSWHENIKDPANFYSIRQAYLDYKAKSGEDNSILEAMEDGFETKFRRWEYMMEPRTYPTGRLPKPDILLTEWNKFKFNNLLDEDTTIKADWSPIESSAGFPQNGYAGRLNCIGFHPLDSNIIFVGAPASGLWKTTDGGLNWTPETDDFPSLGVSEIVFNPQNPDIMFIATGDKDGNDFMNNPSSYGVLKSIDGGKTWDTTGLKHQLTEEMTIQRLVIHPDNPNLLMAAVGGVKGSLRGIWRTTDAGATWTQTSGGAKYDIEFKPNDPNIVYASGWKAILKSTDAGLTWKSIASPNLPSQEITYGKIAVTPANLNFVYVQFINQSNGTTYGLYKSTDSGETWEKKNNIAINIQGDYCWVLSVSPVNPDLVFVGGVEIFSSFDGGATFTECVSGHVDHHGIDFHPITKALFNCNDGGLYKSYNNGNNLINLNRTFQTYQYYRLGCAATNKNMILTGAQDNGSWLHNQNGRYRFGFLADGVECVVDYTDTTIYYASYQFGYLTRIGSGIGLFRLPPTANDASKCAWITPYLIHPKDPKTLYFGAKDIYFTRNRGNSWNSLSTDLTKADGVGGGMLRTMAISESKPDSVLYAASYVVVYRTSDGGNSWNNITSNLPVTAGCITCSAISYIAVHPEYPDIAWVTMSGYSDSNKVFMTTDGGKKWLNISANLPAIPVNCIVYEKSDNGALYMGTDIGVFYKEDSENLWKPYMKNLPKVPVMELEIHYASGKIRAATFGRGLWESNINSVITGVETHEEAPARVSVYPNPAKDYIEIVQPSEGWQPSEGSAIRVYNSLGECVMESANVETLHATSLRIDTSHLPTGIYYLQHGGQFIKFVKVE